MITLVTVVITLGSIVTLANLVNVFSETPKRYHIMKYDHKIQAVRKG